MASSPERKDDMRFRKKPVVIEATYDTAEPAGPVRMLSGIGSSKHATGIFVMDEPDENGGCHEYEIRERSATLCTLSFQNGAVQSVGGVNGIFGEQLIAIAIDRLEGFQEGPFRCRENALAITKLQEAQHWMNHRYDDRDRRGVEGTHEV